MCEQFLSIPEKVLKETNISCITQASDCMGQTFIIEFKNSVYEVQIDRNDDNEFFLSIYELNNPIPIFQSERG